MNRQFCKGLRDAIPIALGYLSVSFGFGIMAVDAGLPLGAAVAISLTNMTSAGQVAGVGIIAAGGTMLEMALAQLVINIRYALMGLSLSQKLDKSFRTPQRLLASFGITDEIFAVASGQAGRLCPAYLYGLIVLSYLGWALGTFLGAAAGELLPQALSDAMGIVLYGMFLALIIPPARKDRGILLVVGLAALCAVLFYYGFPQVSGGFAMIISAVLAAALGALLFPVKEDQA